MNIDFNIMQFLILLIPGYISRKIANSLSRSTIDITNSSEIRELINIIIFSIIDIVLSDALINVLNMYFQKYISTVYEGILQLNLFNYEPYIILICVSIAFGIVTKVVVEKRVLYRIASFLNISSNHGNETAWQYFNNISSGKWVRIKDYEANILYTGFIEKYEIDDEDKYVILTDVTIYSLDTKKRKNRAKSILLKCNKDQIVLECD